MSSNRRSSEAIDSDAINPVGRRLRRPPSRHKAAMAVAFFVLLTACKPSNQYQAPPPPEGTIQQPTRHSVTKYLQETGQLASTNSVYLVARLQGSLLAIWYAD